MVRSPSSGGRTGSPASAKPATGYEDDRRRRGLASPDDGDALALTFAYTGAKRDWAEERRRAMLKACFKAAARANQL
jgi:hypothetical protein